MNLVVNSLNRRSWSQLVVIRRWGRILVLSAVFFFILGRAVGEGCGAGKKKEEKSNQSPSFNNTPPPRPFFISLISFPIVHHYLCQS